MAYKETENYIWRITDKLGRGATANVYKGMNKNNGDSVAIKLFYKRCEPRELRVLKRIDHENIVKFLDIEHTSLEERVIIMEFCNGSSLLNVINQPENALGLDDSEFLLVLRNLYDGIKYLKDNNLIHRDLKPDNIMKCIREDGTNIYKIIDFGAARELEDGEKFVSIYGTEEYLHPDVFKRAFITRDYKSFNGTIDLWSLGATLYHLATGSIPFQVFNGRLNRNKHVMYEIISRKPSGVISGKQLEKNGIVRYQKELPKECLLSSNLREIITPLLAGLMEADLNKAWGYEDFFTQVENILSKKSIHIFYINEVQLLTLYVSLKEPFEELQDLIMNQTGVKAANQMIFFKTGILSVETVSDVPLTTQENPLFLFSKDNNDVAINEDKNFDFPEFSGRIEVHADAQLCELYLKICYHYKREIEKHCLHGRLIVRAFENFTNYLAYETAALLTKAEFLEGKLVILKIIFKFLCEQKHLSSEMIAGTLQRIIFLQESNDRSKIVLEGLTKRVNYSHMTPSIFQSTTLIDLLKKSYMKFIRIRDKHDMLSRGEEKLYNLEKKIAYSLSKKIQMLLRDDVRPMHKRLFEDCGDWYKTAQSNLLKFEILKGDLAILEQSFQVTYEEFQSNCAINNGTENLEFKNCLIQIQNILEECKHREDYNKLIKESNDLRNLFSNLNFEMENYL